MTVAYFSCVRAQKLLCWLCWWSLCRIFPLSKLIPGHIRSVGCIFWINALFHLLSLISNELLLTHQVIHAQCRTVLARLTRELPV